MSRSDPVISVIENVVGLYHPWTSVQNGSGVTSVIKNVAGLYHPWTLVQNGSSELHSSRTWQDCIILELQFRMDPMNFGHQEGGNIVSSLDFGSKWIRWTSVIEKVVGLYHLWSSVQNRSGDCIIPGHMSRMDPVNFGHREGGRIVSSMNLGSEWIQWLYHPGIDV